MRDERGNLPCRLLCGVVEAVGGGWWLVLVGIVGRVKVIGEKASHQLSITVFIETRENYTVLIAEVAQ